MEKGAKDKTRTIKTISNPKVKEIVSQELKQAVDLGMLSTSSETLSTNTIVGTLGGAGTGTLIGTLGGVGTGMVSTGISLGGSAFAATGGAATGAAAGSAVPVVGTAIGALVGLGVGVIIGKHNKQKNEQKKERLMQEVMSKQNTIIRSLEKELTELKKKYAEAVKQNERYKYIIGILMANEELKKAVL